MTIHANARRKRKVIENVSYRMFPCSRSATLAQQRVHGVIGRVARTSNSIEASKRQIDNIGDSKMQAVEDQQKVLAYKCLSRYDN